MKPKLIKRNQTGAPSCSCHGQTLTPQFTPNYPSLIPPTPPHHPTLSSCFDFLYKSSKSKGLFTMAMRNYCLLVLTVVCTVICGSGTGGSAQSLADECASKLPQVMTCVAFASGKESTPQKKCCDSVTEMKESNPACLCFLIQQIHNGTNPALKSMNIQEGRLLQLPSACKLANASISDCPKLLKLPPNSPDAALFNNVTTPTTSPTTGGTTSSTSTSPSHASKYEAPMFLGSAIVSLLFYVVF